MFGFLKNNIPSDDINFAYDEAVIVKIPQASEMGDEGQMSKILDFESAIEGMLPTSSGVDGHEFGDHEALIYLYGPSADSIYKNISNQLVKYYSGVGAVVTLQYGSPDDPATKEKMIAL